MLAGRECRCLAESSLEGRLLFKICPDSSRVGPIDAIPHGDVRVLYQPFAHQVCGAECLAKRSQRTASVRVVRNVGLSVAVLVDLRNVFILQFNRTRFPFELGDQLIQFTLGILFVPRRFTNVCGLDLLRVVVGPAERPRALDWRAREVLLSSRLPRDVGGNMNERMFAFLYSIGPALQFLAALAWRDRLPRPSTPVGIFPPVR